MRTTRAPNQVLDLQRDQCLALCNAFDTPSRDAMSNPTQHTPLQVNHAGRRFRIEFGGKGIGFYLYVYDGNRCTHDYLQDTVAIAQDDALELFGVPRESWREADEAA
jgi:hypothetical protein